MPLILMHGYSETFETDKTILNISEPIQKNILSTVHSVISSKTLMILTDTY